MSCLPHRVSLGWQRQRLRRGRRQRRSAAAATTTMLSLFCFCFCFVYLIFWSKRSESVKNRRRRKKRRKKLKCIVWEYVQVVIIEQSPVYLCICWSRSNVGSSPSSSCMSVTSNQLQGGGRQKSLKATQANSVTVTVQAKEGALWKHSLLYH